MTIAGGATLATEEELNEINFRSAAASLKENEPIWAMQIQMIVGHPVTLELDFDSLGGRYEWVQPFIHQGMAGVVEAFPTLLMERAAWGDFFSKIERVKISRAAGGAPCSATLAGGELRVWVALQKKDVRPPVHRVIDAFRVLNGMAPLNVAEEVMEEAGVEPVPVDPYVYAAKFVLDLEEALRGCDMWPGPKPEGELEVKGAFGSENMAFEQWLAWVLIPRVQEIIDTHGSFPGGSQVAAYATREFDGADAEEVLDVLRRFDHLVNGLSE